MSHRSFRLLLLFVCLLSLFMWSGVVGMKASKAAAKSGESIQPSGEGIISPQRINTAALPHIQQTGATEIHLPASQTQHPTSPHVWQPLASLQNVVKVPAPTSTDTSAKQGLSQQGGKPDANGAGGLDNYLETTNPGPSIYSRSGTKQETTTYQSWFNSTSSFYDPVTVWDNIGGRFIFSVLQTSAQKIWLSVAQQANATGSYCNYSFPTTSGHDFDKLGVNSNGIYFSFNVLAPNSPTKVQSNELFFVGRVALESCQKANYTSWSGLKNPNGGIAEAITPAVDASPTATAEYLVNSYPLGGCQLTLWTLTTSSATLTSTTVPTQCYSPPSNAKQKGSSALISTGDCSLTQASLVNGLLTVDMPGAYDWGDGNGPVSIVQWFVLNPSTHSVSNQGAFGTPGYWLFYPSAITTANGHRLFLYNASGTSIYPSVWYVNQTLTGATALANGVSYFGTSGTSPWGDYQSAWPDSAVSTNAVWVTGEYVKSSNVWGSAFDLVTP
ncbi:MAG TPA: hypothetical protein DHW02_20480 [Ktedonobacter sp.]|nr:hypothetical protein [Ktedonobacter sp.]